MRSHRFANFPPIVSWCFLKAIKPGCRYLLPRIAPREPHLTSLLRGDPLSLATLTWGTHKFPPSPGFRCLDSGSAFAWALWSSRGCNDLYTIIVFPATGFSTHLTRPSPTNIFPGWWRRRIHFAIWYDNYYALSSSSSSSSLVGCFPCPCWVVA